MKATLYRGDCLDVLASMEPDSVDAIVCDPPYGLGFMGRKWDALPPGVDWARLCLRVLKPGGHLVAFGGTRTVHRLATAIEDGGFEIRDMVSWLYWSGFPKSKNVALSIDKGEGHPNRGRAIPTASTYQASDTEQAHKLTSNPVGPYEPRSEAAKKWNGYGTALKPAQEPAVLARKPLSGTVAVNALQHGVGVLNIDGCRFAYGDDAWPGPGGEDTGGAGGDGSGESIFGLGTAQRTGGHNLGRWPANIYAHPKASRSEREAGCERLKLVRRTDGRKTDHHVPNLRTTERSNHHPTVKPIGVMRWLCKLTGGQPGSVILDPFMGSGTTGCAAVLEGFDFIGIEREPEYMQICEARIRHHMGALFAHGVKVIETEKAAK
jgi:site-specific DNA-methyltransferase (adenine-specific)